MDDDPCNKCVRGLGIEECFSPVRTDVYNLSKITITLTEIEDPKNGRGCKVDLNGEASTRSMRKMLESMFLALAEKEELAFYTALDNFLVKTFGSEESKYLLSYRRDGGTEGKI